MSTSFMISSTIDLFLLRFLRSDIFLTVFLREKHKNREGKKNWKLLWPTVPLFCGKCSLFQKHPGRKIRVQYNKACSVFLCI